MLIKELDVAIVDSLGDLLSDLVRAAALDHVQLRPAVLRLRAGGRAHEQIVLELALQVVLLDVVCQSNGNLPNQLLAPALAKETIASNVLGITHTREAGPADVRAMRKQINQILSFSELVQIRRPANAALQKRRSSHLGDRWAEGRVSKMGGKEKKGGIPRIEIP